MAAKQSNKSWSIDHMTSWLRDYSVSEKIITGILSAQPMGLRAHHAHLMVSQVPPDIKAFLMI
jgi:hypothetical protein